MSCRPLSILYLLSSFVFLPGCGYTQSGSHDASAKTGYKWHSLYRQDIHSVFVPTFDNKDYTRGVEFKLTKAVIHEIQANTPYRISDREHSDSILEGEITAVRTNVANQGRNTVIPQEQILTLTINFIWKDMRTGRILTQRKGFEQSVAYYPTMGEGSFVATQESAEKLAIGIVQELQAPW